MVNSLLPYLQLTVELFQFLRLSTKFLAVLRLSVDPIGTLFSEMGKRRFQYKKHLTPLDVWKQLAESLI